MMEVPFFKISFGRHEEDELKQVLKNGWVTSGPKVKQFEQKIADISGVKFACAVSSGSAGLLLSLKALGIGDGDEVITTPFTMISTIEAILHTGAKPVLADIDPLTLNIDPASIEKKITKRAKAIIAVDIAGIPCDYQKLRSICRENSLSLLSDAAHSFGGYYKSKPVGCLADATVFSFYPTKNITTGEGGMVVSNKKRLIDKVRNLSLHAMSSSGYKRYQGGSWQYDVTDLGYKFNMSDLQAALGLGQLKRFRSLQKTRKRLAAYYLKKLKPLKDYIELPPISNNYESSRHLFIIKLKLDSLKMNRDRFIMELEKMGIGCGVHFIPVYKFSYYQKMFKCAKLPHCEESFQRVVSLPFYPDLTFDEIDFVGAALGKITRKFSK